MLALIGSCLLNSVGRSDMPLDIILQLNQATVSNSIERVKKTGTGHNQALELLHHPKAAAGYGLNILIMTEISLVFKWYHHNYVITISSTIFLLILGVRPIKAIVD